MATHQFVRASSMNLGMAGKKNSKTKGASAANLQVQRWVPPPVNCCKMNVDVMFARLENRGAFRVVCCSGEGFFQGTFAMAFEGVTHPRCLEALAY
jgi:hypothetical protein